MQPIPALIPSKRTAQQDFSSSPERALFPFDSAQRIPEPELPKLQTSPPPLDLVANSKDVLTKEFQVLLNGMNGNAWVGRIGGFGTELRMPKSALDGRSLTWNKWSTDVGYDPNLESFN
jgi:hypothetical protein